MSAAEGRPDFEVERKRVLLDDFFRVDEVWFRRRKERGELGDPERSLSLERGDSVAVLLHNRDTGRVILVDQFRYPTHAIGGWITETVAGMLEADEAPEDAVRREALEETGYRLDGARHLASFYSSPGGSSEQIHLYFAEVTNASRVGPGGGRATEGEDISLREYTPLELADGVAKGEFKDAKTLVAVLWFLGRIGA